MWVSLSPGCEASAQSLMRLPQGLPPHGRTGPESGSRFTVSPIMDHP